MRFFMKKVLLVTAVMFGFSATVFAQEDEAVTVTDEELHKYAVLMDSVEAMKENVKTELEVMVDNNEEMTKARYNDLIKVIDDEEKLAGAEATEAEIAFINSVVARKEALTDTISSRFKTIATEYVTPSVYKKVKTALKKDPGVKDRYKLVLTEVTAARKAEESAGGEASTAGEVEGSNR